MKERTLIKSEGMPEESSKRIAVTPQSGLTQKKSKHDAPREAHTTKECYEASQPDQIHAMGFRM
eukprot:1698947-Rhodomonas_salina.1